MRILICGVVTATLLYGGYWIVGSRSVLSGVETALAGMKQEGVADYASVSIRGFPSRFDLTVESPVLASRDGLERWPSSRAWRRPWPISNPGTPRAPTC